MKIYKNNFILSNAFDRTLQENPHNLGPELKGQIIASHSKGVSPFKITFLHWTKEDLDKETCGPKLWTPHVFTDGIRDGKYWESCQMLAFDVDNKQGQPLQTTRSVINSILTDPLIGQMNPTIYIHHSRNHDPENGTNKFHVMLFIDQPISLKAEYLLVYNWVYDRLFAGSDRIGDFARCIIPGRMDFQTIFRDGEPLRLGTLLNFAQQSVIKLQQERIKVDIDRSKKQNEKNGKRTPPVYIPLSTLVEFVDGRIVALKDLDPETEPQFLCPYCGSDPNRNNPGRTNATYQFNDSNRAIVYCSSCDITGTGGTSMKGVYNICQNEVYDVARKRLRKKYSDYFYLEDKLARVVIQMEKEPFTVSIGKVSTKAIEESTDLKEKLLAEMAREAKTISTLNFNQEGCPYLDVPEFKWNGNVLIGLNPAIRPVIEDNRFIENWLTQLFGTNTIFIKQWLAMYCYTNYVALPVLILYSKERGTGKNVFAEAVCSIYEPLHSRDTDYEKFTEAFKGKLWYIDEQSTDGKKLYQAVKQIGGNNKLEVNNKYGLKYQVDRNLSVILTTNNLKPMEMEADELQLDETNNQFFVMEMKALPSRSRSFPQLIKERLGHYIRTELKDIYDAMQLDPDIDRCRYGMRVPVTEEERRLLSLLI